MTLLCTDKTFHYELLRVLGTSRSYGADIGEVLDVAGKIIPGDFESNVAISLMDVPGELSEAQENCKLYTVK